MNFDNKFVQHYSTNLRATSSFSVNELPQDKFVQVNEFLQVKFVQSQRTSTSQIRSARSWDGQQVCSDECTSSFSKLITTKTSKYFSKNFKTCLKVFLSTPEGFKDFTNMIWSLKSIGHLFQQKPTLNQTQKLEQMFKYALIPIVGPW